jgi:hypothetical protein
MPRGRGASRRSWPVLGARPEAFQGSSTRWSAIWVPRSRNHLVSSSTLLVPGRGLLVIPPLPRGFDGVVDLIGGPQVPGDRGANAAQAEELLLVRSVVLRASDHVSVGVGVHRGRSRPLHEFNLLGGQRAPAGCIEGDPFRSLARETGKRNRRAILLAGAEHRYMLKQDPDDSAPRFVVTAAPALEFEVLERTRRHGLALPPIFSWTVHQPAKPAPSDRARDTLVELLDEFYERKDHPEAESADRDGDEVFDVWLRVLDARDDLARGEHQPIAYKRARADGPAGLRPVLGIQSSPARRKRPSPRLCSLCIPRSDAGHRDNSQGG